MANPNPKELIVDWLKDAHAMESSIVSMLEKQVDQLKDRPMVQGKIKEHLEITREQRDRVKALIEKQGGDVSKVKETTGKLLTNVQAMVSGTAHDSVVKNAIGNFAVENFEIASYRSLIAAAEAQGLTEVVRVCKEILDQEQEMANWLAANIPRVTTEFLGVQTTQRT